LAQVTKENAGKKTRQDSSDTNSPATNHDTSSHGPPVNPILAGIFNRTKDAMKKLAAEPISRNQSVIEGNTSSNGLSISQNETNTYQALAQSAVGRGIRHTLLAPPQANQSSTTKSTVFLQRQQTSTTPSNLISNSSYLQQQPPLSNNQLSRQHAAHPSPEVTMTLAHDASIVNDHSSNIDFQEPDSDSLTQLKYNFHNSLNQSYENLDVLVGAEPTPLSQMQNVGNMGSTDTGDYYTGFLSRTSSLIDLAMIDPTDESFIYQQNDMDESNIFSFIDFPCPEVALPMKPPGKEDCEMQKME
jgi:hypothetical protein